ncbi:MAG: hypothetical protein H6838_16295 [Planctomycetes bacterium]|nr:hypothetical protein [Planctomycetota bacterium]MCB9887053.1 hypothetical protein [Planctomycetota bacterium]
MRSNARPVNTMVGIERALRDPGPRGIKSIRGGFRRVCREYEHRVQMAQKAIKSGFDLEWEFNTYVVMSASRVFGQSPIQTLIDLVELGDPILAAFMQAFPPEECDAVLDRFFHNHD